MFLRDSKSIEMTEIMCEESEPLDRNKPSEIVSSTTTLPLEKREPFCCSPHRRRCCLSRCPCPADNLGKNLYHVPIFTIIVFLVELVFYILWHLSSDHGDHNSTLQALYSSPLIFNPSRKHELWRFFTYMLHHSNVTHLITNIVVQTCLSATLEITEGHLVTATVFFSGVLGGSMATSLLQPYVFLIGASGGAYALLGCHMSNILLNFGDLTYICCRIWSICILCCADLAFLLYQFCTYTSVAHISWAAHLGGGVAGILVGMWVLDVKKPSPRKKILKCAAIAMLIVFTCVTIFCNIFVIGNLHKVTLVKPSGDVA